MSSSKKNLNNSTFRTGWLSVIRSGASGASVLAGAVRTRRDYPEVGAPRSLCGRGNLKRTQPPPRKGNSTRRCSLSPQTRRTTQTILLPATLLIRHLSHSFRPAQDLQTYSTATPHHLNQRVSLLQHSRTSCFSSTTPRRTIQTPHHQLQALCGYHLQHQYPTNWYLGQLWCRVSLDTWRGNPCSSL